jgi:sugar diacid utilization regulator
LPGLTIASILAELEQTAPGGAEVAAGPPDREVRAVWLAEELREVESSPRDALVVLSRSASREAHGYKLDVALRRLGDVAGLMLQSEAPRLSASALAMARRKDLALVWLKRPIDLTALVATVVRLLDAGIPMLLERTMRLCQAIERAEAAGLTDQAMLSTTGAADLFGLTLGQRDPRLDGVPAVVTDHRRLWIQREPTVSAEDSVAHLAMWRLAAAITKRSIDAERAEQLSMLSAGELLTQLLEATAEESEPLARRAADLGIHVPAWHEVVEMRFENLLALVDGDPVTAYQYTQILARVAAQTAKHEGGWAMAPRAGGVLLLHTQGRPSDLAATRKLRSTVDKVLERTREPFPDIQILCGVGGCHEGLQGLHASQAEATAALQSARFRKAFNEAVMFDAPGLSRLLVEWYSSSSVRQGIDDLLAPLATLGPAKQKEYGTTLRVYLENNKSLARTAKQMFLHRNTIAYRINRIVELLGIDLEDPNQFLAVYLACYAKSLPGATAAPDRAGRKRAGAGH